jgi:hypothetical protein
MNNRLLGQFYTTKYAYILQNMRIPEGIHSIIEPFAGNGDLLNFIEKENYNIECYDIEPKKDFIVRRDTLLYPPNFDDAFVITNPPYLARNKSSDKSVFDKYNTNDLYKCFLQILIGSRCVGGILILPLNFLCSIRKGDIEIRERFVNKYDITVCNIFEEQVFKDTSYSICSFQFRAKQTGDGVSSVSSECECHIYPENKIIHFTLCYENNYTIGGEIYNLRKNTKYKIDRATKLTKNTEDFTNILVKCIDDNIHSKIGMSVVDDLTKEKYIDRTPNLTARSYAILVIEPKITLEEQSELVDKFNTYMTTYRDKYNSLFLTNYRESNTIARKRISFGLVYDICGELLPLLLPSPS